jgi:hypothetical protein
MAAVSTDAVIAAVGQTGMDVSQLRVEQIIAHRVFERSVDKTVPPPKTGNKLINLPVEGREAIQKRITAAIGNRTHGVEMSIERIDKESFFQLASDLIHATDKEFVEGSKKFAEMLTQAQGSTSAPAGMLAVVRGRVGATPKRYVAVIKADVHDGFAEVPGKDDVDMQYLQSLLLTGGQKLYKVGLLIEMKSGLREDVGDYEAGNYRALLYDHLITSTETREAAAYFFSAFLGMSIAKSSKKLTKDFFEHTRSFIDSSSIEAQIKAELKEALRAELRSSNGVINATEFASTHFPEDLRKPYRAFLESRDFPKNAIVKDVEYVKSRLRKPRSLVFDTGVKIVVPATLGADAVTVLEHSPEHAVVRIKGDYVEQD